MDAKKIFQPKIWYILCGAMALLGGIDNNINAESWAKSAWGADGVNDQSVAMEVLFGVFMIGFGAMGLVCAFVLEGTVQAKFAMVNGGVMIGFFILLFIMLGGTDYALPSVPFLAPPFVLFGGLITAGYLHMNDDEAPPAEV